MKKLRYLTAGESHNKGLVTILDGMPSGLTIDQKMIDSELALRQGGYGRGGRMIIEQDHAEIISGIRMGKTMGSPISIIIKNKDWENYKEKFDEPGLEYFTPRPGHADLPGMLKYGFTDCRNVLERASARETAARVVVGSICQQFLDIFGVKVYSYVTQVGKFKVDGNENLSEIYKSKFYTLNPDKDDELVSYVKKVKEAGDTLGGVVETIVEGLPPGVGNYTQHDLRLDSLLASQIMSIPSIKGVEFGAGFAGTTLLGSEFHDSIYFQKGVKRKRNNAGGIEGGMSNGEPIVIRSAIKPIPTVKRGMETFDIRDKKNCDTDYQRSDVTVIPAASIVLKNAVAFVLAKEMKLKFGGDNIEDTVKSYQQYLKRIEDYFHGN